MGLAKTGRPDGAARYHSDSDSGEEHSSLDEATRGRVKVVCDFVNSEVARWRNQLIAVGAACLVGMVLFPVVTRIVDARVPVIIAIGIFGFWFYRARRELASSYSKIATKRLVAATSKELTYRPASSLTREHFVSLDLFPMPGNGWRSGHEIAGRVGNAKFSLHGVHAPGIERGSVAFDGVIIRLDFAASFPGHTVVLPEQGQTTGPASRLGAKRDLVLVKNPDFERMFSAYSTEYMPARQLFTPALMELIVAATETLGTDLRLAFVGRSLFAAIPNATLLPEVSLLSSPLTPEQATGHMVRLTAFADGLAKSVESN